MSERRHLSALPLSGVRVLDLTRVLAGPFATMMLADLGADVVKIERPGRGDETRYWGPPFLRGTATYFVAVNRNKRSVALDLKRAHAARAIQPLLDWADVVVSNFRHGALARLGLDPPSVARTHPRLVQCTIVGFRPTDPRAAQPSYDLLAQADSGLMAITGAAAGGPTKVGISIADEVAGLYVVQGILAALLRRHQTDQGGVVEVPLNETTLSMFTYQAQQYLTAGVRPRRMGNEHPGLVPYRPYRAADGELIVAVASEQQWRAFCTAADLTRLLGEPQFADSAQRVENRDALEAVIEAKMRLRPVGEWISTLRAAGVPCGAIRELPEALQEERRLGTGLVAEHGDLEQVACPLTFDGARPPLTRRPPDLGEHTEEVFAELGVAAAQIERWRLEGVI